MKKDLTDWSSPLVPSALPGGIITYGSQQNSAYRPNILQHLYVPQYLFQLLGRFWPAHFLPGITSL